MSVSPQSNPSIRDSLAPPATVIVAAIAAHHADAWIHEQRKELSALDLFGICAGLVHLNVQQEPTFAQHFCGVDDARGFFVLGDESRVAGRRAVEVLRVVGGYLDELACLNRVQPDLGDAAAVARVFVRVELAALILCIALSYRLLSRAQPLWAGEANHE